MTFQDLASLNKIFKTTNRLQHLLSKMDDQLEMERLSFMGNMGLGRLFEMEEEDFEQLDQLSDMNIGSLFETEESLESPTEMERPEGQREEVGISQIRHLI